MSYSTTSPPTPPPPPSAPLPPPPLPPAQPPRRRSRWLLGCGVAALVVFVGLVLLAVFLIAFSISGDHVGFGPKIALIHIEGVITAGRGGAGLLGGGTAGSLRIVDLIRQATADDDVRAIILRINSPGGSAAGSQEIWDALREARAKDKTVVASMGDVAASGGYYVASAADAIVANGSTLTGSIGVIWSHYELDELFEEIGIRGQVVKSGQYKDIGSMSRAMTPAERELVQGLIDDVFDQFVDAVVKGRKMPRKQVEKLADGRIFTGRQAKNLKLVDEVGGFRDAVRLAAKRAGIPEDARVVEFGKRSPLQLLMGEGDTQATDRVLDRLLYDRLAHRLARSMR